MTSHGQPQRALGFSHGAGVASRLMEVAVPVPLRKGFTYEVPHRLGSVAVGTRVVVPFGGRRLIGFVVDHVPAAPADVTPKAVLEIVREDPPPFPEELWSFLQQASRYYAHPLGEVLKAAAPSIPRDELRRLSALLSKGAAPRGMSIKTITWVRCTGEPSEEQIKGLGSKQREALRALASGGARPSGELALSKASLHSLQAQGLVALREVEADPFWAHPVVRDRAPVLTAAQGRVLEALYRVLDSGDYGGFLLQGVTGSGKTEVYLHLIERALAKGKGALVLVPEISLTPQLVDRFRARFGDGIAVLHSGVSERQRYDAWWGLRSGRMRVAVGARSALFAPIEDLGVVVVDEEHDSSFKQEEGFRYHARDMAVLRASRAGAVCVLGSATPSLESRHRSDTGKLTRLVIDERATRGRLPKVEVVDLKQHRGGPGLFRYLAAPLHRAMADALAKGEQVILFLNRRGFSPTVRCASCGVIAECPACSVSLTEHRREGYLRCHYCDFQRPLSAPCTACGSTASVPLGVGTEQLEDAVRESFEGARVGRLDRDTSAVSGRGGNDSVLRRFRDGELDVLVGTQMVTKGHDLARVTVVGVVLADQSLAFPDFRASERTFQLLCQVAGRAGRGSAEGRAFFQTYSPEHPAIQFAAEHDYEGFYRLELESRAALGYPPEGHLVMVRVDAGDVNVAEDTVEGLARMARHLVKAWDAQVDLLGPTPAPIERLRGRYRFRFLLRARDRSPLRALAVALTERIEAGVAPARASVDTDPVSTL